MIIIIEGADGVGKTTVAQELQKTIPLSTLIKLSGSPKDVSQRFYMQELYYKIYPFLEFVSEEQHVILDRFTTSERVYSKLFKGYDVSYLDEYEELLDDQMDIIQVYLSLPSEKILERIENKKTESPNEKHPSEDVLGRICGQYYHVIDKETGFTTLLLDADQSPKDIVNDIIRKVKFVTGEDLLDEIETAYSG